MHANDNATRAGSDGAWRDRRVVGWALYDVASSSYVAVVPLLFPLLYAAALEGAQRADASFALLGAVSLVIAGIVTPVIGVLADRGRLVPWLAGATALCCVACAVIAFQRPGSALLAGLAFVGAQTGYTVAMALYDSFLPRLASTRAIARVSAFGWAAGLCGGILTLLVVLAAVPGRPEPEGLALAIGIAAALFALLAVPALLVLRGLAPERSGGPPVSLRAAARAVADDLRAWRQHGNSARFLLAYLLINDVSVTVVLVATLFLRETFGTSLAGLIQLILLYHLIAAPATLVWGRVADRIGLKRAIHLNLFVWAAAILLMAYARGEHAPWLIVTVFALVIASTNALCRALYARLVPVERSAEFFGFNAVIGRMSAALGPTLYATVSTLTGAPVAGLLSLLVFVVAGGAVLLTVDPSPQVDARGHAGASP